jgi:hypothetical protein
MKKEINATRFIQFTNTNETRIMDAFFFRDIKKEGFLPVIELKYFEIISGNPRNLSFNMTYTHSMDFLTHSPSYDIFYFQSDLNNQNKWHINEKIIKPLHYLTEWTLKIESTDNLPFNVRLYYSLVGQIEIPENSMAILSK